MWCCCFLMRNGWMLHFLHLFHDKSFHPHWVSFKPWLSFKPCKIIFCIQVDYFLPEMVGTTSVLGFCFQILELFSYGIFSVNFIYIIWKQICLHVLAFDCDLSVGLIWNFPRGVMLALSSFQFCSFLKLDFQTSDA